MNFSMGEGQSSSVLYFSQVLSFRFLLFPGAAHSLPVTSPYPPSSSITVPSRSLPVLFSSLAGRSLPFHHHSLNVPFPIPLHLSCRSAVALIPVPPPPLPRPSPVLFSFRFRFRSLRVPSLFLFSPVPFPLLLSPNPYPSRSNSCLS